MAGANPKPGEDLHIWSPCILKPGNDHMLGNTYSHVQYMYILIYIYIHTHTLIYIYICTHTHIYTHTYK